MFKRIALLAATTALAAACASNPAASTGGSLPTSSSGAVALPGTPAAATSVTVANLAAITAWLAEEKLMPADPVLALVSASGGDVDYPQGVTITCNAANGGTTVRLGKQAAARIGQDATFRIRTGAGAQDVSGKFVAGKGTPDADFQFTIRQADLLAMSQLDMVSIVDDQGAVQWAFVKDPAAQVQARYVGSLKDMPKQAQDFIQFCNPK